MITNTGSSPAIVMGISGKPDELIDLKEAQNLHIPIIKRFSGGGTVVVDDNTLFVSFIFNSAAHPFKPFPQPIMEWSSTLYHSFIPNAMLRENDYVIGNRKFGGNAQYLKKGRWLHHSTLLWDYNPTLMNLLRHPAKTPAYRLARSHEDFITPLKEYLCDRSFFFTSVLKALSQNFTIAPLPLTAIQYRLANEHRQSTQLIPIKKIFF